ncbi:MAG TPA: hypothetical protein VFH04_02185 [Nitrososphaeraceae archaeon]|nr:hypothetical protein [Nitrososphaeraceae archaeon]
MTAPFLSIIAVTNVKEILEGPKKKRCKPKIQGQSANVANDCCKWPGIDSRIDIKLCK